MKTFKKKFSMSYSHRINRETEIKIFLDDLPKLQEIFTTVAIVGNGYGRLTVLQNV